MQTKANNSRPGVYSPFITERLKYTLRFSLGYRLGLEYDLTDRWDEFIEFEGVKICYGRPEGGFDGLIIPNNGILGENEILQERKKWFLQSARRELWNGKEFRADLFGLIFFLLSRYEAYLPHRPDRHMRFSAFESVLHQKKWLDIPMADEWCRQLGVALHPQSPVPLQGQYSFLSTLDIDFPWLYLNRKPFWRFAFIAKRKMRGQSTGRWRKVRKGERADPYDTYGHIRELHRRSGIRPMVFFHVGQKVTRFDRTACYDQKAYGELIGEVAEWAETGLHPSYYSSEDPALIGSEKARLEELCGKEIRRSRQHFLKVSMPHTCRALARAGIEEDHSTGFANRYGFATGSCVPWYFYDLKAEATSDLCLVGLHLMDRTLSQYMGVQADEALERALELVENVRRYKGVFSLLWHNSSLGDFDGWAKWRPVYEKLLIQAAEGSPQFPILPKTQ